MLNNNALAGYVERLNHLLDERAEINESISDVYTEAKGAGFVPKHLRTIVREHRMESDARQEMWATLDEYRHRLGMLDGTPLGNAAMNTAAQTAPKRGPGRPRKPQPEGNGHNAEVIAYDVHKGIADHTDEPLPAA